MSKNEQQKRGGFVPVGKAIIVRRICVLHAANIIL